MTAEELARVLNTEYGPANRRPATREVDAETYGHCCQAVFNWYCKRESEFHVINPGVESPIQVFLGKNQGLMFKGVELVLQKKD